VRIRPAQSGDAAIAAELILASAPNSLNTLLDLPTENAIVEFLIQAFSSPLGQFGYGNHWVVEETGTAIPIALGCCWTSAMGGDFHRATLLGMQHYFGTAKSLQIVQRSSLLTEIVTPPTDDELCIGHLGVIPQQQRQGAATLLVEHFVRLAKQWGKNHISLDVEESNQNAIAFYLSQGFTQVYLKTPSAVAQSFGFTPHIHMLLSV
jgi:ribosomal protein S18 acetylase RimI-like enzyme